MYLEGPQVSHAPKPPPPPKSSLHARMEDEWMDP